MANQVMRITLKAYEHQLVDASAKKIIETVKKTGAQVSGPVPLPTKTQALLEKMEHFLNTNFPEGVDDCAFLMGKISEEVVKYAHKSDIDCIVVGAHGRIGFRQLFAGSVATEVVKKAHCSVSVIRPRY